jgi:RNA polymerase sigma-70 factor, ECF subfamily
MLPMAMDAAATVAGTRAQDRLDFDALFAAFYRRLARLLFRITGDTYRAEELAAEAFWRLHKRPPAHHANLEGWLYRTGLRLALDQLKRDTRRARYESLARMFSVSPPPDQALLQSDERRRIRTVMATLSRRDAELLVLHSDGLTHTEIAAALDLHAPSVGTFLARAQRAFRREFERRYGPHVE